MFTPDTEPKVSIIISTYNGAKYIGETIESVRSQTYSNWELIIADDGSTDNTCEVIESMKDERIHLYRLGRIGINGKVKNIALEKCLGEMIAFIDHDDIWAPTKLEKQVASLKQYPEAGFSLTGGYNFKEEGVPVNYFYKEKKGVWVDNIFFSFFRSEIGGWTQALLVRKNCVEKVKGFSETSVFADPAFIASLASQFKAVILYEPLVYHRLHDTNYTTLNWIKSHGEGLDLIRVYKENKQLPASVARDVLFRSHIHFGEKCLNNRKPGMSLASFVKAWGQKPFSIVALKKIAKAILYSFRK